MGGAGEGGGVGGELWGVLRHADRTYASREIAGRGGAGGRMSSHVRSRVVGDSESYGVSV